MVVHLDGKVTGDYVLRPQPPGAYFPCQPALATRGADTFQVASPPPVDPTVIAQGLAITSVTM